MLTEPPAPGKIVRPDDNSQGPGTVGESDDVFGSGRPPIRPLSNTCVGSPGEVVDGEVTLIWEILVETPCVATSRRGRGSARNHGTARPVFAKVPRRRT